MSDATRWALVALGVGAILAPGGSGEVLGGAPLSVAGLVAVAVVLYVALALPRLTFTRARWLMAALGLVLVVKLLASATATPLGLKASYWPSVAPTGAPERSTDFAWLDGATRIDPALDLRGEDFAVHFFNDAARFNVGPDVQPGRDQLPFSVRWQGWLLAPSDGQRRFVVESTGPAQLWLDDAPMSSSDAVRDVSAGLHVVRVDYSRPEAQVPSLRLSWQPVPGGPLETLSAPYLRWPPTAASPALSSGLGVAADVGFVLAVLAWLASALGWKKRHVERHAGVTQASRKRHAAVAYHTGRHTSVTQASRERHVGVTILPRLLLAAVPLLFGLFGLLLEAPAAGRATILSGLDDWLVYESSARDILLNGLLMDGGQGHAPPFYGQPLYLYVLAVAHRLTGEALFGPLTLQFAALGAVVVGTAVLARRAFGTLVDGIAALACFLVLLQLASEHFKIARQLFNENLYMPLVMASLIVLVTLARRSEPPSWWQTLASGLLLGTTAVSRSQFLLFLPLALLVLALAWRRGRLQIAVIVLGTTLAILPFTARNWIASGQFVPISSSGGASLLEFHRPPPGLTDQAALQSDPLFQALHLDQQTRTVVAFARTDPGGYLATLAPLGAHSLGLQGRNDPGVYWPLLLTVLAYVASFVFERTRRLHVWPVHAFVATHLLVLMLFEADTYGYRLVMPMYAPMVAVAAQVPLAMLGHVLGVTRHALSAERNPRRATRFAQLGWSAIAIVALLWQAKTLVDIWPEREPALHGLGGAAAHAALTAERVGANAIYVASVDGTPRRFGAGSLPGLRYPWFKWFDPVRSLPLAAEGSTAVYVLSELSGGHLPPGDLTTCLGPPDASAEVVIGARRAETLCSSDLLAGAPIGASFDGVARIDALRVPEAAPAGEAVEARVLWEPLVAHPQPHQVSLQLDDPSAGDGTLWGNSTLELYPAGEWQVHERLLSRLPISTDPTALPQAYRLTLGLGPTRPNAPPATAVWNGSRVERVPVAMVTLTPGTTVGSPSLPADMRALEGPPLVVGGLELIGARPLPTDIATGNALRIGLLWRATANRPSAAQIALRLVRDSGEVVQELVAPVLGGRVSPSTLNAGNVVRVEQKFPIGPGAPNETLALEVATDEARVKLGSVTVTGRQHVFDSSTAEPMATFGDSIQLLSAQVEPLQVRPGDKITVKLRWRSAAELAQAYKVFVHVLDPAGANVVAQRDSEPQDGRAPTTGWVVGEVIDDDYAIALPASVTAGEYRVEVGVYEPRSGDRMRLADGDNRLVLRSRIVIR